MRYGWTVKRRTDLPADEHLTPTSWKNISEDRNSFVWHHVFSAPFVGGAVHSVYQL